MSSPLEGLLVRDQVRLYLDGLEHAAAASGPASAFRLAIDVRHRARRLFDYVLELHDGERSLGRQSGTYSFEEFRGGFGRALETVLTSPPELRVLSLDEFVAPPAEELELRRAFIEQLEATERLVVLESADFAHHRLHVHIEAGPKGGRRARMQLDAQALEPVAVQGSGLWAPALAVASRVGGVALERVRLALFEYVEEPGLPRPLRRGPMDYRLGSEARIRQASFDGEGYPVLVERGARLTILRFGYYPRAIRLRDESAGLKQVYLIARTARVAFRIVAPGHPRGRIRLLGYDGEELAVADGDTLTLKRGYKYRYSMEVHQGRSWRMLSGWFILPADGPLELHDEQFPNNLELTVSRDETPRPPAESAEPDAEEPAAP